MSADTALEVGRLYGQLKRIADVMTASQKDVFVRLPGLVAYWPMGIRTLSGNVIEHSGAGFQLSQTGTVPTGFDGNSNAHLGNGTNFLATSAALGVTGTEASIDAPIRGLTIGGWFDIDALPVAFAGFISKDASAPNRGYLLFQGSTGDMTFQVSGNGAAATASPGLAAPVGGWVFLVGKYAPSVEVTVFVGGNKASTTVAIPVACFASTAAFEIGRILQNNSYILTGRARDVFVCASALDDDLIEEVRQSSVP